MRFFDKFKNITFLFFILLTLNSNLIYAETINGSSTGTDTSSSINASGTSTDASANVSGNSATDASVSGNSSTDANASVSSTTDNGSSDVNVPSTYSPACLLMDQNSGKILYSKNANTKMYPASTTKIMTAILTLENYKLTDTATASHNAIYSIPSGYSIASIREGETLTIEQLLNVLLIPSANDAAVVLAEHIGGSVENFANMMNEKAVALGCKNTHFINPNGIHSEDHYSTAYDLALMGKYAMTFPDFRRIVSKTYYALPATEVYNANDRLFNTTNELIRKNASTPTKNYYYEYATGAKTGYTDAAKNCIVATATKGDVSLLAVVLHDSLTDGGLSQRALDCKALFEYGFNNYSEKVLFSKDSVAQTITVKGGTKDTSSLDLLCESDISALIPNSVDVSTLTPSILLSDNISAPIAEGTNLGNISYTIDGITYTSNLIASHTVYKEDFIKVAMQLLLAIAFLLIFARILHHFNNSNGRKSKTKAKSKTRNTSKSRSKNTSNNYRKNSKTRSSNKKSKRHSKDDASNYLSGFYPKY